MFVGAVKFFWGQSDPYAGVTPARAVTREHTAMRHDLPSQHDLPRQAADDSRLARAAEISLRQIDRLTPLLEPVE